MDADAFATRPELRALHSRLLHASAPSALPADGKLAAAPAGRPAHARQTSSQNPLEGLARGFSQLVGGMWDTPPQAAPLPPPPQPQHEPPPPPPPPPPREQELAAAAHAAELRALREEHARIEQLLHGRVVRAEAAEAAAVAAQQKAEGEAASAAAEAEAAWAAVAALQQHVPAGGVVEQNGEGSPAAEKGTRRPSLVKGVKNLGKSVLRRNSTSSRTKNIEMESMEHKVSTLEAEKATLHALNAALELRVQRSEEKRESQSTVRRGLLPHSVVEAMLADLRAEVAAYRKRSERRCEQALEARLALQVAKAAAPPAAPPPAGGDSRPAAVQPLLVEAAAALAALASECDALKPRTGRISPAVVPPQRMASLDEATHEEATLIDEAAAVPADATAAATKPPMPRLDLTAGKAVGTPPPDAGLSTGATEGQKDGPSAFPVRSGAEKDGSSASAGAGARDRSSVSPAGAGEKDDESSACPAGAGEQDGSSAPHARTGEKDAPSVLVAGAGETKNDDFVVSPAGAGQVQFRLSLGSETTEKPDVAALRGSSGSTSPAISARRSKSDVPATTSGNSSSDQDAPTVIKRGSTFRLFSRKASDGGTGATKPSQFLAMKKREFRANY